MIRTLFTRTLLLVTLSVLSTNPASAQLLKSGNSVFNYNYVDALYLDDDDADGLGLRFSADIRDNFALQVGYARISAGRSDADTIAGGVAYHIAAASFLERADWVFDLGFQIIDADGNDDTGLYAGAGIRYAANAALELNGSVNLTTAVDTDLDLNLRALYEVATGFSAMVETYLGDGASLGIGLRFYWR